MKWFKVSLSMVSLLVLTLIFTPFTTHAANFKDVTYEHWAYEDIQFIVKNEVIRGYSDGTFRPNANITRQDAVIMMIRALDLQEDIKELKRGNDIIALDDMSASSANYYEIQYALKNNWLTVDKNRFNPRATLTRDEMAKMIATIYSYEGEGKNQFKDVASSSSYYPYIDAIAFYQVTSGYQDQTFRPKEAVTRAQFSVFVSRVYQQPVAYEVKSKGEVVAVVPSVKKALEEVAKYEDGTIHPQSNKFVRYSQQIGNQNRARINNGVLIYNGFPPEHNDYTPEFFNHYLKSENVRGDKVDLFDTFIILGLRYNAEGNQFVDVASNQANYADWDNYIKRTFSTEGALYNLNKSAIENNRRVDVYISIPYPKRFGDIISLTNEALPNNSYSRYDLARWYVEKTMSEFNKNRYSHLNLKGYYWLSETVRTVDDGLVISSLTSLLKQSNKNFIYSPHASSTNFYKWKDYGFDSAFLQPNAFRSRIENKEERLHQAYLKAQIYGTGITMEIDSYGPHQVEDGVEAFDLYNDFAKRYGLDNGNMIFYQANNMVERMATIDHPIYQNWYQQLKDTFFDKHTYPDEEVEEIEVEDKGEEAVEEAEQDEGSHK